MSFRSPPPYIKLTSNVGIAVALLVASVPSTARAGCPSTSAACNAPGNAVCQSTGGTSVIECDLTRESGNVGGTITAVLNTSGSLCSGSADYCIWGTESTGTAFCCEFNATTEGSLLVIGTVYDDTVSFQYSTSDNLSDYGYSGTFVGQVNGNAGDDTITGSRNTDTANYNDNLNGNGGLDTINGDAGDDDIDGGDHDDIITGGPGADTIFGQDGADTITGGAQDDLLYGNAGADLIAGSAGADTIRGDDGEDTLCGDSENDDIAGGIDNDTLWGGTGTDNGNGGSPTGGGTGDTCDVDVPTDCETTGAFSRPSTCPGP